MIYKIPVTTDEIQEQSFTLFGMNMQFTLRYNFVGELWNFDLFNQNTGEYITQSAGLSVNSPVLITKNLPFVIVMTDALALGFNSMGKNELGKRLSIYFIDKGVWRETIRAAVQSQNRQ